MKLKTFTQFICFLPLLIINGKLPHSTIFISIVSLVWCIVSGYYYSLFLLKNFENTTNEN
jgi:hypothetical protein